MIKNIKIQANLKFARVSPQKARLVADQIRGQSVEMSLNRLSFSTKKAALIIKKALESAIANAENNKGANVDNLFVSYIAVNEGPKIKRVHARAKGRAARIVKRMSHIVVKVAER